MAEIKGTTIQSRLEYIKAKFGEEAHGLALQELKRQHGQAAEGFILPMSWYPLSMDDFLCRFIQKRLHLPGEEAFLELGRHSARGHLKLFKTLLDGAHSPADVIAYMPRLHHTYSRGYGDMTVTDRSERSITLRIVNANSGSRSLCASNVAYMAEMCRLVAEVPVRHAEPACICRGDKNCEYRFEW
jgi:hypothetical protein